MIFIQLTFIRLLKISSNQIIFVIFQNGSVWLFLHRINFHGFYRHGCYIQVVSDLHQVPIVVPSTALSEKAEALELSIADYQCHLTSQRQLIHRMLKNTSAKRCEKSGKESGKAPVATTKSNYGIITNFSFVYLEVPVLPELARRLS